MFILSALFCYHLFTNLLMPFHLVFVAKLLLQYALATIVSIHTLLVNNHFHYHLMWRKLKILSISLGFNL